jgi:hypothetical protein
MWIIEGLTKNGTEVLVQTTKEGLAQVVFDICHAELPAVTMRFEVE